MSLRPKAKPKKLAVRPSLPGEAWWARLKARLAAALARPLPPFSLEPLLVRLTPGWVLLAGGLSLAALYLAAGDQLARPGSLAPLLFVVGLALMGGGVLGLRDERRLAWLARPAAWLRVRPGQLVCLFLSPLFVLLTGALSSQSPTESAQPVVANLSWVAGLSLLVAGGWVSRPSGPGAGRPNRGLLALAGSLLALALLARGYNLNEIPITLTGDEGSSALNAVDFITGRVDNLFGIGWHGFPALYYFIQSLPIAVWGNTISAARLASAVAGALTVVAVYLMGRSLWGHRAGLAAALFLAGFHFHQHFSRIGLNNVWDGLSYVLVLGAVWHAWKSQQRASFLLAGVLLGLSQYFYPSTRALFLVVPAWLAVCALLNPARFFRLLPDLLLMALAAAVTFLPLGWFYWNHPDEFFGAMRAVSVLGPNLERYAADAGLPIWQYLLRQLSLGLGGYVAVPLQYWYRPDTPLLRAVPAGVALLGLIWLVRRPRDPRLWLMAIWALVLAVLVGLSESTPAAQRLVGAVGVCALLVGYGVDVLAGQLVGAWPRLARAGTVLVVGAGLLLGADELRFYWLNYTVQSHYGGRRDFEGVGSAVAGRLANYMHDLSPEWRLVFFGSPIMGYDSIPSLAYRVPALQAVNMTEPWGSAANPPVEGDRLVFAFVPGHEQDLAGVQTAYPGGLQLSAHGLDGHPILDLYQVPAPTDPVERSRRLAAAAPFRSPIGAVDLGVFYLMGLSAWAVWRLARVPWLQTAADDGFDAEITAPPELPWFRPRVKAAPPPAPPTEVPAPAPTPALSAPMPPVVPSPAGAPAPLLAVKPSRVERPPAAPAVSQLQIGMSLRPGARLRLRIEDLSSGDATPTELVRQDVLVPENPADPHSLQAARVVVAFSPEAPAGYGRAQPPQPAPWLASAAGAPARTPTGWPRWRLPTAPRVSVPAWLRPIGARLGAWLGADRLAGSLFAGALLLYLTTRLVGLERYPVYFFTDEAAHTALAADFVRDGWRNYDKEFLPTYFSLGPTFNLNSVTVYLQVVPYLLFGQSMVVTRAVSALVTVLAAAAVGLTLRNVFKVRYWWAATLLLSTAPAWFLHSRTAFENVQMAAYYAGFVYCYLRYRTDAPRLLYAAVVFGALTFYTHGLGLILMAVTALLLLLTDLPYHWQQRAIIGRGFLLALLLALPYFRYALAHPSSFTDALRQRGSYWLDPAFGWGIRFQMFLREYLYGLSPQYWFTANNNRDIERHVMNGYGNLWLPTLPLFVLGLLQALWRVREPGYRVLLLVLLATPVGSALVAIGIPRILWFIIPAVILMSLGLELLLGWLGRLRLPYRSLAVGVFALLAGFNLYLCVDALRNGDRWPSDYTLGGVQWGARQLFGTVVPALMAANSAAPVYLSPNWANGTELLPRFFMTSEQLERLRLEGVEHYLSERRPLEPEAIVGLMASEYEQLRADPKIGPVQVVQVVNYPNGQPGFYFIRFEYSDQAEALFAAEQAALNQPVIETFLMDGEQVQVTHSHFGAGQLRDMLDGDNFTLINAPHANPLQLAFEFPRPRRLTALALTSGSLADMTVTVIAYPGEGGEPVRYSERYVGLPPDPTVTLPLAQGPAEVSKIEVQVMDNLSTVETVNVHVRDVRFEQP